MNRKTSGSIRSSLFNIMIRRLMERGGYFLVQPNGQNKHMVRKVRNNFLELRGRGCWHQIDCPCIYERTVPFLPPVRLIGEVKYHMSEVKKESVRNFLGVLSDIREGSMVMNLYGTGTPGVQRTDMGVIFAANGFWPEAERLAYSHEIRTVSYKNNRQMRRLKELIFELESRYLDYDVVMQQGNFLAQFEQVIDRELPADQFAEMYNLRSETVGLMEGLVQELEKIKTSFFASTAAGIMIHFLGNEEFPAELFASSDTAVCRVGLEASGSERSYYLQLAEDENKRRFYFSPPEGFQEQALYGWEKKKGEGGNERVLYASMKINGLERSLRLVMDTDWWSALSFEL